MTDEEWSMASISWSSIIDLERVTLEAIKLVSGEGTMTVELKGPELR